ncbi:MAG: lipopolysaccharide biosynthesis protein [Leptolyngbyaceae cyanobacterium RM2_2_4]|nr:lipopolysaccharide biosynthesis protein [Leptolyngbyaceae cyanobacterium RM2_2_4]
MKADLKGRSVRGATVTMVAQGFKFVLRTGSTAVLARLLVPQDYGLIGMATVVVGFAQIFKDLGLANATVQKAEVTHAQVSTLFWLNMGMSMIVALIVAVTAPVVAWFYDDSRLIWVTAALASTFVFGGLAVQHQALLRRQMRFNTIAKIDISSMTVSAGAAVVAALLGAGYWSLVVGEIARAATDVIGSWLTCGWRPGRMQLKSGVGSMVAYGGNLTAFNVVNYFSRNLDNVLIGKYWGAAQLGLYAKAYQLVLLPIQQINIPVTNVALPALSRLQLEPERYCNYYYKAILLITTVGMPIVAFMFASADKVILLLLGDQWLEVVPIFRFLMPAAFLGTFNVATGWAYQSLGRTDRQFLWGIFSSLSNVIGFIVGIRWGAVGVAAVFGLTRPLFLVPSMMYCFQGTPLKASSFFKTLARPTLASLVAAGLVIALSYFLTSKLNLLIGLSLDIAVYGLTYIAIWIGLPDGKNTFLEILKLLKASKAKK